jgi:hypothetical protein
MAFSDYLTSLFIKDEDVETARQVAAGQQSILDRQREEGKVDSYEYYGLTQEIEDSGTALKEAQDKTFLGSIPWWVWALLIIGAMGYFGMLGPLFALGKRKATAKINSL